MPSYVPVLRRAWHASGLSAAHVAARAELSERAFYHVLGGRKKVRFESVAAIAAALDVSTLPVTVRVTVVPAPSCSPNL